MPSPHRWTRSAAPVTPACDRIRCLSPHTRQAVTSNRQQGSLPQKGGLSLCSLRVGGQREGHAFLSHSRQQTDSRATCQKCHNARGPRLAELSIAPSLRHRLVARLVSIVALSSPACRESRRLRQSPSLPPSRADVSRACRMVSCRYRNAGNGEFRIAWTRSKCHPVACSSLLVSPKGEARVCRVTIPAKQRGASVKAAVCQG